LHFEFFVFFLAIKLEDAVFSMQKFLFVILCMVFARSAAMAFNRWADREIDKKNPRTFVREIPAGIIKPNHALMFVVLNTLLFVLCTWFINPICFYLSPVALLVILGYSLTKRFTALCHLVLGLGLSLAPIGAFLAVSGKFNLIPILLSISVMCWVSGFDIIYALQDEDFDRREKLQSIPAAIGKNAALALSRFLHLLSALLIFLPGYFINVGSFYWIGFASFAMLLAYQHSIIKAHDLSRINIAFFTTNGVASVIFALFFMLDFYFK
jgi:4-hydroxybenzoate polyprenyltransferase